MYALVCCRFARGLAALVLARLPFEVLGCHRTKLACSNDRGGDAWQVRVTKGGVVAFRAIDLGLVHLEWQFEFIVQFFVVLNVALFYLKKWHW